MEKMYQVKMSDRYISFAHQRLQYPGRQQPPQFCWTSTG